MTSVDSPGPSSRSTWRAPTALPQSMSCDDEAVPEPRRVRFVAERPDEPLADGLVSRDGPVHREVGPAVPLLVLLVLGAAGLGDPVGLGGEEGAELPVETDAVEVLVVALVDEVDQGVAEGELDVADDREPAGPARRVPQGRSPDLPVVVDRDEEHDRRRDRLDLGSRPGCSRSRGRPGSPSSARARPAARSGSRPRPSRGPGRRCISPAGRAARR